MKRLLIATAALVALSACGDEAKPVTTTAPAVTVTTLEVTTTTQAPVVTTTTTTLATTTTVGTTAAPSDVTRAEVEELILDLRTNWELEDERGAFASRIGEMSRRAVNDDLALALMEAGFAMQDDDYDSTFEWLNEASRLAS